MTAQDALFEDEPPRYCLDTNVVVSFLKGTDDEYYGVDIFGEQWALIERLIASGVIVAPRQVSGNSPSGRRLRPRSKRG